MKVDGVRTCFKNINRCNLHPQCDPVKGSRDDKTSEDELDCYEEYWRKKLFSRQATFRCQSPHHNEDSVKANLSRGVVYIHAVLQDNNTECWNAEDEKERPTEWVSYYFPGIEMQVIKYKTLYDTRSSSLIQYPKKSIG